MPPSRQHYNEITFDSISEDRQKYTCCLVGSLLFGVFLLFIYFYGYFDFKMVYGIVLFSLIVFLIVVLFCVDALFKWLYIRFGNKIKMYQAMVIRENDATKHRYIPTPTLINHRYWIKRFIDFNDNNTPSVFVFPLVSERSTTESNFITDTEKNIYKLYRFLYAFSTPEKKMQFFIQTFFVFVLLFFCFIFLVFYIYVGIIDYVNMENFLIEVSLFVLILTATFGYWVHRYVSLFYLEFLNHAASNLEDKLSHLSKRYSIYYFDGRATVEPSRFSLSHLTQSVNEMQLSLMDKINAILQISIPIIFLSMISISLALFQHHHKQAQCPNVPISSKYSKRSCR